MTYPIQRITPTDRAKTVSEAWRKQYQFDDVRWARTCLCPGSDIYEELVALGDSPTPDQISGVIGNTSWTDIRCDACGEMVDEDVEFPGISGKSKPCWICPSCIAAGASIFSDTHTKSS